MKFSKALIVVIALTPIAFLFQNCGQGLEKTKLYDESSLQTSKTSETSQLLCPKDIESETCATATGYGYLRCEEVGGVASYSCELTACYSQSSEIIGGNCIDQNRAPASDDEQICTPNSVGPSCVTLDNKNGKLICNATGSDMVCIPTNSGNVGSGTTTNTTVPSNTNTNTSTSTTTTTVPTNMGCYFNGQVVLHGQNVTGYQSPSVQFGQSCQSQVRTCNNGTLSGTYASASCTVQNALSCDFNGIQIPHGQTTIAYRDQSVAFGSRCESETRLCNNGVLTGSYSQSSCNVTGAANCSLNGYTVAHGFSISAYESPSGSTCNRQERACFNGQLSGTFQYSSCQTSTTQSCNYDGVTISHNGAMLAYESATVPYDSECKSQNRICQNGTLTGSYQYRSCVKNPPPTANGNASCQFNGTVVPNGGKIKAYFKSSQGLPQTCEFNSEDRYCINGSLQGTAPYSSCVESCTAPSYSQQDGATTTSCGCDLTAADSSWINLGKDAVGRNCFKKTDPNAGVWSQYVNVVFKGNPGISGGSQQAGGSCSPKGSRKGGCAGPLVFATECGPANSDCYACNIWTCQ